MSTPAPNRRSVIAAALAGATGSAVMSTSAAPSGFLAATRYLDFTTAPVQRTIREVTAGQTTDIEKALSIFQYVRDRILFGFAGGFWDHSASDVLRIGRGYCNTKSTLFVALLRGAGVPARQVFVDIDAAVLHGVLSPGTPFVDHSYVEVFLGDAWRATDAYIVDAPLFARAQRKVNFEDRLLGYGVHATGASAWNGRDPTYAQFNRIDPRPLGTREWGVFADVGEFYARVPEAWNRLNPILRVGLGALAAGANFRLDAMRTAPL
jgi:transglutaminase-like putative cysteine protease